MALAPGRLVIVAGLPGSGKSTLASRLAARPDSIVLSPDVWMDALGIDLWDTEARGRIEALQWQVTEGLLTAGGTCILEWGTWTRLERARLRDAARALGAKVELRFLDAPPEELYRRVSARGRETPPITLAQLEDYSRAIERPDAEELALYDTPEDT